MGDLVRGVAYRARQDGRQGRLGWLLLISGINFGLWTGVIALITSVS